MKTCEEWSLEFDLLYNNIVSDKAPGLEEYEKSVFLTRAQEAIVKDYFSARTNQNLEGFDDSERRQADFKTLITTDLLSEVSEDSMTVELDIRNDTHYFLLPEKAFLILNENLKVVSGSDERYYTVVPISYEEYARLMMRPYKYPTKGQVWRLLTHTVNEDSSDYQVAEIIGRFPADSTLDYRMRYVKRPSPIILLTLDDGLSIDGETQQATCQLPEHLHMEILQRAVMLAKLSWSDVVAPQQAEQR